MTDLHREIAIAQGYVPAACTLPGVVTMALINRGEDPCAGCNLDRKVCKGRPKGDNK